MESKTDWAPSPDQKGFLYKIIQRGACTTTILRPELSDEERAKRMKRIKQDAIRLVLNTEKSKYLKNRRKA